MKLRSGKVISISIKTDITSESENERTVEPVNSGEKNMITKYMKKLLNDIKSHSNVFLKSVLCSQLYEFIVENIDFINSTNFETDHGINFIRVSYDKIIDLMEQSYKFIPSNDSEEIFLEYFRTSMKKSKFVLSAYLNN
jgi:hypothetical protein